MGPGFTAGPGLGKTATEGKCLVCTYFNYSDLQIIS